MKRKHCDSEGDNYWYKNLQRFRVGVIKLLFFSLVASAHIVYFLVK